MAKLRAYFFPSGNTAVFNADGEQVVELQEPWLLLFAAHLEAHDVDPCAVEVHLPDGRAARFFRTERGLNWDAIDAGARPRGRK